MHNSVGKIETRCCRLDPARAQALHVVLNGTGRAPEAGEALPAFWHQVYFWNVLPETKLGRDGHIARGGFIPDLGLPRRMWAAGGLTLHQPILLGTPAKRISTIEAVETKHGRSGPLGFCTLRHDIHQNDALCVSEKQVLVYRADPAPEAPQPPVTQGRSGGRIGAELCFSAATLFRYSALTMNGHRIHYDAPYARDVEGYAGLVVHGPLLIQTVFDHARAAGRKSGYSWRSLAPLFAGEAAVLRDYGDGYEIHGADGRCILQAWPV